MRVECVNIVLLPPHNQWQLPRCHGSAGVTHLTWRLDVGAVRTQATVHVGPANVGCDYSLIALQHLSNGKYVACPRGHTQRLLDRRTKKSEPTRRPRPSYVR